jgi:hypothetical protein
LSQDQENVSIKTCKTMLVAWEKNPTGGKKHLIKSVSFGFCVHMEVLPWVMGNLYYIKILILEIF